jgi:hypothetical protein
MFANSSRLLTLSLALAALTAAASPGIHGRPKSSPECSGKGSGAFIGGSGAGNVAAASSSAVVSGGENESCHAEATIGAGDANTIYSNAYPYAVESLIGAGNGNTLGSSSAAVGAGIGNVIGQSADYAFIGAGQGGSVTFPDAFVGAGKYDSATAEAAFVGAGLSNTSSGTSSFIGAGSFNVASAVDTVVDAGLQDSATHSYASVTGGGGNVASGNAAAIPGGYHNLASGQFSFAAGIGSYANTVGSFVWSDDSSGAKHLAPARANEFIARSAGGTYFVTNAAETTGAMLAPGSGTWASASDRTLKSDVAPVSDEAILAKVAALSVTEWSYTSERGVRHLGPMAQDFYAAFGLGADDRHITAVDEDGIALAAIKGLDTKVKVNDRAVDTLRASVAGHGNDIRALRAELRALEARIRP